MTTAIILAGGLGTRLRPIVSDVPKPMCSVAGQPFLELLMRHWVTKGVSEFILSIGYMASKIINHFGATIDGTPIEYIVEEQPIGTGGGLLRALSLYSSDAPALLLNGDTFFDVDLDELRRCHARKAAAVTLSLMRAPEAERYGSVTLGPDGSVHALSTQKAAQRAPANGGVYLLNAAQVSEGYEESEEVLSFETDILGQLLRRGASLGALVSDAPFIDIGVPEDYARAQILFAKSGVIAK